MTGSDALLTIEHLAVEFATDHGPVEAVRDVSLEVRRGETLGIAGESGSGKSVSMMAVMGLLPSSARITAGSITFDGQRVDTMRERAHQRLRGRSIGFVFQNAMAALNPVMRIGRQLTEAIRNDGASKAEARQRAIELLADVGIPEPERRLRSYPHEFSGGMRQRVMIALAVANRPQLIIADEPTTALDVTIQSQVLTLLERVKRETGATLVLITHDLAVMAEMADRVVVMYGGRVVETAAVDTLFHHPGHPYTTGLLRSIPRVDTAGGDLAAIPGAPLQAGRWTAGCSFAPRCDRARGRSDCDQAPELAAVGDDQLVACHFADEAEAGLLVEGQR